jgi:hypothetical protein
MQQKTVCWLWYIGEVEDPKFHKAVLEKHAKNLRNYIFLIF